MTREDGYMPPEMLEEQLSPPIELISEHDLVQFWLTFRKNDDWALDDPEQERQRTTKAARQSMLELGQELPVRYYVVKNGDEIIATGKLEIQLKDGEKHGYISLLSVRPDYRGKNIAKQLTDIRTEAARRDGCVFIDTSIRASNPIALTTKFNDGYCLNNLEFYDQDDQTKGWFDLSKRIEGEPEYDRKKEVLGELKEVDLSDLITIKSLLGQGWVGIDIKNLDNPKNNDPKQWKLIMEQTIK